MYIALNQFLKTMERLINTEFLGPLAIFLLVQFLADKSNGQSIGRPIDSVFEIGLQYLETYDYKKAVESFYFCQREVNHEPTYHYYLANAYEQLGNIQDARIFYHKAWTLDSLNVKYIMALGKIEFKRHDYVEARSYFARLIEIDSTNSFYYKQLGKACYYDNDMICAIASLGRTLQYNDRDLEALRLLADIYYNLEEYDFALEYLERGLFIDPKNPLFLRFKLKIEVKQEYYDEALVTTDRLFSIPDSSNSVMKYYGIALTKTGRHHEAIPILRKLANGNGVDEGIHYFLSEAYGAEDSIDQCIMHLEMAMYRFGIGPMVWRYCQKLSSHFEKKGDLRLALDYMEKSSELKSSPILLFHFARLSDEYYRDKRIALNRYENYLASEDSLYRNYAESRVMRIKEYLHQSKGKAP